MQAIRILIADPTDLARQGLRALFSAEDDFELIASCRTIEDAVSQSAAHSPDVAIVGYGFAESQRLDAVRKIVRSRPHLPVLVLTDRPELIAFLSGVRAGARGYLGASADAAGLVHAIRTLNTGGCVIDPSILRELFTHLAGIGASFGRTASSSDKESPMGKLSHREQDVLRLLAQGKGNKEIGAALGISPGTAKTHLRHIFKKLKVTDRTGAVLAALDIDPSKLLPAA